MTIDPDRMSEVADVYNGRLGTPVHPMLSRSSTRRTAGSSSIGDGPGRGGRGLPRWPPGSMQTCPACASPAMGCGRRRSRRLSLDVHGNRCPNRPARTRLRVGGVGHLRGPQGEILTRVVPRDLTSGVRTRGAVIQRVFRHDVDHCAGLNETLGIAGCPRSTCRAEELGDVEGPRTTSARGPFERTGQGARRCQSRSRSDVHETFVHGPPAGLRT